MAQKHSRVLILDFGSQYTQLITRRIRELGVYSFVMPGDTDLKRIKEFAPHAVILSGGPSSVYDEDAPQVTPGFFDYLVEAKLPALGICYGMQLIVREFGGRVRQAEKREYGRMEVRPQGESAILTGKSFSAWMSHGDEAEELPEGFTLSARSAEGAPAVIENIEKKLYGLQFHPEVTHTENGSELLRNFCVGVARVSSDWSMRSVREEQIEKIRKQVAENDHVICALSGGVDSTVAAKLVHEAIGDRLHCVFVDNGLLRYQERERVEKTLREELGLPLTVVDARDRFLGELSGVTDPEEKRKIIGKEFIGVFKDAADTLKKELGQPARFLVQGTLYPDVIESSPAPSSVQAASKHSVTIKSHHNVGGLPKDMPFELIEPLRDLFKDEVRQLGAELGVPKTFLKRHPFPGPGLAVRVLGEIKEEYLEPLRLADEIYTQALIKEGLYDEIWQAFAVFLPIRSVGVQGDGRTHNYVVALRAVTSHDGMTADWYPFTHEFLAKVSARICNEVQGISRVVYDVSSKPPATIEWE